MEENTVEQHKRQYDWLKPYQWKKGESGNPEGGRKGKSLKSYLREYFEGLSDEEKAEFFKHVNPEIAWRMAEGNPQNDLMSGGKPLAPVQISKEIAEKNNVFTQDPEPSS